MKVKVKIEIERERERERERELPLPLPTSAFPSYAYLWAVPGSTIKAAGLGSSHGACTAVVACVAQACARGRGEA